jgi:hypothetical protein
VYKKNGVGIQLPRHFALSPVFVLHFPVIRGDSPSTRSE